MNKSDKISCNVLWASSKIRSPIKIALNSLLPLGASSCWRFSPTLFLFASLFFNFPVFIFRSPCAPSVPTPTFIPQSRFLLLSVALRPFVIWCCLFRGGGAYLHLRAWLIVWLSHPHGERKDKQWKRGEWQRTGGWDQLSWSPILKL